MRTLAPPCADKPDLFFSDAPSDVQEAKRICSGCWRLRACLQDIEDLQPEYGVWAGLAPQERGFNPPLTETQWCRGCDQSLPVEAFTGDPWRWAGHIHYCQDCRARRSSCGAEASLAAALRTFGTANAGRAATRDKRLAEFAGLLDSGVNAIAAAEQLGLQPWTRRRYEKALQVQRQQEAA